MSHEQFVPVRVIIELEDAQKTVSQYIISILTHGYFSFVLNHHLVLCINIVTMAAWVQLFPAHLKE